MKILLFAIFLILNSYAQDSAIEGFSLIPPSISKVLVQKNSEWEELYIVLDYQLSRDLVPAITDSTVELAIENAPPHSALFQTAGSSIAKGIAWSNGKLVIYLNRGRIPAVMVMKNRVILQMEVSPGKLENMLALPTGVKSSDYFLPSAEPLSPGSLSFAQRFERGDRRVADPSLMQTIQVKKSDASYIVAEDEIFLYSNPTESSKLLARLEFGTRLKVLEKKNQFYRVRHQNNEGYVYQREVLQEADLTTSQKDRIRRLKIEAPGGVDSVAAKFGWRDNEKIVYSSYGYRDPFVEVKSEGKDGIIIDNLVLVGIIYETEMPMAIFSDNKIKGKSYVLSEQDTTIKNGRILKITQDTVLFLLQEYGVTRRSTMTLPNKYGGDK
jgi:uncharacterized protein YgiM (DUF1202 family)